MIIPLSNLKATISAKISHVKNEDVLIKLVELGIMPGVELTIQNRAPFNGPLSILVNGTKIIIREREAQSILVETV